MKFSSSIRSAVRGLLATVFIGAGSWLLAGEQAYALTCQNVRQLVGFYFKMHFSHHDFGGELGHRTLDTFIKSWDPGKVYFLKSDVQNLDEKYGNKLGEMLMKPDCAAIEETTKLFAQRFEERQKLIAAAIDAKHDFTVNEYLAVDRKKLEYATSTEEIAERWRQRVKFQLLQLKQTLGDLDKAREKLHKRYQLAAKRQTELKSDDMYSLALNAFSTSLDPHSSYMSPEELEDFRISTSLSLEGIGAVLRSEDGFTTIQSLVPGGAAANTGKVNVNDKIIAVAQGADTPVDVIDMDLREVVKLIRGTHGTEVRLTLVRDDAGKTTQLVVPITREQVQLKDRAAKSYVYEVNLQDDPKTPARTMKIGVIELPSFYMDFEGRQHGDKAYKSSSADMLNEINKLKKSGIDAMIVDLRSNGGGSLDESIDIAGFFFDKGPVVQVKDMRGTITELVDKDARTIYSGPLLVMINRQSASASEIFAGAIQDYGRGLIIGNSHTFGKGTVQNLNDVDKKLGAIKVTISKFYRPSGASTQLKGVESDVVLPDILDEYEIGEKYYDYALPWEKIAASKFKANSQVTPAIVTKLREQSKERVSKDKGYEKMMTAIKDYRANESERLRVSLKEEAKKDDADKNGKKDKKDAKGKDKKKGQEDDEPSEDHVPIADDAPMQEGLRIAANYVQLLGKETSLAKTVLIPEVEKAEKARVAAEKKAAMEAPKKGAAAEVKPQPAKK